MATYKLVKKIRQSAKRTQTEAARDVHVSLRTWQSWEANSESEHSRRIPEAYVELFCIKNKLKYPPK